MKNKDYKEFVQCDCGSEYVVFEPQDPDCLDEGLYMSVSTMNLFKNGMVNYLKS